VDVEGHQEPSYRLYTRWNVELATLLGGPIAGALLLRRNFRRLGKPRTGRRAMLVATAGTAAVLVLVLTAEASGMQRGAISLWVELTFLSAIYLAFDRWMRGPLQAHVAAGGETGPWWHALPAAAGGLAILLVVIAPIISISFFGPVRRGIAQFELEHSGGTRFVFATDIHRSLESRADLLAFEIENALRESAPPDPPTARVEYRGAQSEIAVMYADPSDGERFDRLIAPDVRRQLIESARLQGGREVRFGLSRSVTAELLGRTAEIIRRRVEGLTDRAVISRVAGEQVIVEIPERAAAVLARLEDARGAGHVLLAALLAPHSLEFRVVDDADKTVAGLGLPPGITLEWDRYEGPGGALVSSPYLRSKDRAQLATYVQDKAPRGREFRLQQLHGRGTETSARTYLLDRRAGLTGEYINDVRVAFENSSAEKNRPYVQVTFNGTGAELFAKLTAANVKKRMAIVLDNNVDSAPIIQTGIPGGICSIHLGGLKPLGEVLQEAKDLVATLRFGALPVPVRLVSEEHIKTVWRR